MPSEIICTESSSLLFDEILKNYVESITTVLPVCQLEQISLTYLHWVRFSQKDEFLVDIMFHQGEFVKYFQKYKWSLTAPLLSMVQPSNVLIRKR